MKGIFKLFGLNQDKASDSEFAGINFISELKFEWVTKKWVRSNKGFEVKGLGRYEMEYSEPNKLSFKIKKDIGFTTDMKPCVVVSPGEFNRAGDRKAEVMDNFVAAMKFQEMEVSFE